MRANSSKSRRPERSRSCAAKYSASVPPPARRAAERIRKRTRRTGSTMKAASSSNSTSPDLSASRLRNTARSCASEALTWLKSNIVRHTCKNSFQSKWPEWLRSSCRKNLSHSICCACMPGFLPTPCTRNAATFKRDRIVPTRAASWPRSPSERSNCPATRSNAASPMGVLFTVASVTGLARCGAREQTVDFKWCVPALLAAARAAPQLPCACAARTTAAPAASCLAWLLPGAAPALSHPRPASAVCIGNLDKAADHARKSSSSLSAV
mmetsp:Transcript_7855/g.22473  ORF Transcript_7855/g.22473 Transcript_7855/m.22473 type:complete len:268 (-) Transcript_7855:463-1266(-)